ncbi:MAG: glycogen/starch synthase [Prevotellaceae bacterium]|jgi:starch synthase|nr:glycogen/starch synthase [Prevotellaceae bacterium]
MTKQNRILFVSQEITPYVAESEISKISRYLPQHIQEKGYEIRSFMPRYGNINERRNQLHEVIRLSGMNIVIDDNDHPLIIKVASIPSARMQVYLIDNEDYFQRKSMVTDEGGAFYGDNDERMIFFSRGTLETIKKLRWQPSVVHCHGWFSMMTPFFVKKAYHDDPLFAKSKIVASVYDEEFNAHFDQNFAKKAQLDGVKPKDVELLSANPGYVSLMKFAFSQADGIIIGSPKINAELQKFISTLKIPVLPYQAPEHYVDAYAAFYDEIIFKK